MEFLEKLYERAKKVKKTILFPESKEKRVLKAVKILKEREICNPVLLDNLKNIDEYVELYCEIRKHKKVKKDDARKLILGNPVFYAALAVRSGEADGFVAGASLTTRDVVRSAIHCIGAQENTPTISSTTIVILPDKNFGSNGVFIYADCSIIPDPTPEQLRDITLASVKIGRMLLDDEVKVAMLSYSTKGSGGTGKSVEKVRQATKLVIEKDPLLLIDGEVQLDCAIVPDVTRRKDPQSKINGKANILIFPNLDTGNIAYKLTERFAKAYSVGPVIQGLKKPVSDLSRGCNSEDIVNAASIVAVMAQNTSYFTPST